MRADLTAAASSATVQARAFAQEPAAGEGGAAQLASAGGNAAPSPAQLSQLCRSDVKGDKKDRWMRLPTAQASVTQHRLSLGGKSIEYTATAGTLIVRDDEDKSIAGVGYIAYTGRDGNSGAVRPLHWRSTAVRAHRPCGCTWARHRFGESLHRPIRERHNNRWTSTKCLLGESYGTTRAAAIVNSSARAH